MSPRRTKLILLCEDRQHEAFLRRFFKRAGWHPRSMRIERSPHGRGAGEQWVRERLPKELATLRQRHVDTDLVAMVDADTATVAERLAAFDSACRLVGVEIRQPKERVGLFVPRRSIETWIAFLSGQEVDEGTAYPRLNKERDCDDNVKALAKMCDDGALRAPAPPSLQAACDEFNSRLAKQNK